MITRASCPSARSATGRAPTTSPKPPALTKCAHSEATKRTEGARGIVFSGEYEVVERRHNDAHDTLACNETRRDWDHEAIGAPAVDAAESPCGNRPKHEGERRVEGQNKAQADPRCRGQPLLVPRELPLGYGECGSAQEPDGDPLARHGGQGANPETEKSGPGFPLLRCGRCKWGGPSGEARQHGRIWDQQ